MKYPTNSARWIASTCALALWLGGVALSSCSSGGSGGASGTGGESADAGRSGGATGSGGAATGGAGGNGRAGGTGGGAPATGGATASGGATGTGGRGNGPDGGAAGAPGSGGQTTPPDGGGNGGTGSASLTFNPSRAAISGVRGVTTSPASQTLQLHNGGTAAVQVTQLTLGGADRALFHLTSPAQLPATVMPGGDLAVVLQMDTVFAQPPPPTAAAARITGVTFLTANLTATLGSDSLVIPVFGLVALEANLEATFGQILTALGYPMNVGRAQNDWNWNNPNPPTSLGGVEAGTDEVAAQLFVKAGPGDVTMVPVARFSPEGEMPFGWYRPGMSNMLTRVGALAQVTNAQTSSGARTIYPPIVAPGTTSFDPGTTPFALWAFTGQAAAGTVHGDYNYSQDALNLPAPGIHRVKAFTVKNASGPVPNTYLLGFEEASNGDYQDYVFVLGNARVAP